MNFSDSFIKNILEVHEDNEIRKIVAQSKAKQVLREVREDAGNYPNFPNDLDHKATYLAYSLLSVGCNLMEKNDSSNDGYDELYRAADILESAHKIVALTDNDRYLHCLIGAMAFYSCGHYSRAFVLIKNIKNENKLYKIISSYLMKDTQSLILEINEILLKVEPNFNNKERKEFDIWAITICIARSISLILEYTISGRTKDLEQATVILQDAVTISKVGAQPALWWICRLLSLMLCKFKRSSFWSLLPNYFDKNQSAIYSEYIRILALQQKMPVIELWKSQIESLELATNSVGSGGVINLRTSAGKTRVAEISILNILSKNSSAKILYLAPFRSLALELERNFNKIFSPLGYDVSHLYGGLRFSTIDKELLNDGSITIATPEKIKSIIRSNPEILDSVKLIIIDEGHLIGGSDRDIKNEIFLEHLRNLAIKKDIKIILLSAVLPNASDLSAWLGNSDAVAKSNWKPSSERFGILKYNKQNTSIDWIGEAVCFNPNFVNYIKKGSKTSFPKDKKQAVSATAIRLSHIGPVLVFAGQARSVPATAKSIIEAMGSNKQYYKWEGAKIEWEIFEAICDEELGEDSHVLNAAKFGVISHSGDLTNQVRLAMEKLMAKCLPKIIVSTTTLGQGVNIGISCVIFETINIGYDTRNSKPIKINKRDFWNICGRAGRSFIDSEGKILFAIDSTVNTRKIEFEEKIAKEYFDIQNIDKVESGIMKTIKYFIALCNQLGLTKERLIDLVESDDFSIFNENQALFKNKFDLIDDELLALHLSFSKDIQYDIESVRWVEEAFSNSLASIQLKAQTNSDFLIKLLKARTKGLIKRINQKSRQYIVSSGLPISVAIPAFNQISFFRKITDNYLGSEQGIDDIGNLVANFENWVRKNADNITIKNYPEEFLVKIRTKWIGGESINSIKKVLNKKEKNQLLKVMSNFYGYELPWIINAIAQQLDKELEFERIEALSKVALLLELGLPTTDAAKVFLSGIKSRHSAVEISRFISNPEATISGIRRDLVDEKNFNLISKETSKRTVNWLKLLVTEYKENKEYITEEKIRSFELKAPDEIDTLHLREVSDGTIFLCSTDGSFKIKVKSDKNSPSKDFVNNPRFIFSRIIDNDWEHQCRYPRY